MKTATLVGVALTVAIAWMLPLSESIADQPSASDPPVGRTMVLYFHRTQRCPTCLKMGTYSEEAVKGGFAQQLKDGKVEFHFVDFQDERNAALTKGYKVTGPTLIVAKVAGSKVVEYRNLTEIWEKAGDRTAFIEYVQANVRASQK